MSDLGSLSSLGAGSGGVLSYDVIDKLKQADEATMVDPFKRRLSDVQNKENALTDLTTQVSLFKTGFADFKNGEIFQTRLADVSGDSVSASVTSGVAIQTINMDVKQLAQNDIYQSKGYSSETTSINSTGEDQTITIGYGDNSQTLTIENGATLSDLKDQINDSNMGITASIVDTGSDENPYKLILKGDDTGKNNTIKMDYGSIDDLNFNDINYNSKKYDSEDDSVTDTDTTFKITINGEEHSMDVSANTSVSDYIDQVNDNFNKYGISASYNDETGKIELDMDSIGNIDIDEGDLNTDFNGNTDFTNDNRVQDAQNSEFSYNGVDVERENNKVEDLIVGLTMNLDSTGTSTINIKQDTDKINEEMQNFVSGYNSLVSKIQDLTKFDTETKASGVFQNESSIKNITSDMSNMLFGSFIDSNVTKTDRNGSEYEEKITLNASDFGFSMNRTGFLDFDSSKFDEMLKSDPDKTQSFFSDDDNGAFSKILNYTDSLTSGSNSTLELLSTQYSHEESSFQKAIDDSQARINSRYQTMAQQFASYDTMIQGYTVQEQSVQQAIDSLSN